MIPFGRAAASGLYRRVVMACSAQSGKTETIFDLIGQRMDEVPAPILYVGPNKQFITEQLEPRIVDMIAQSKSLSSKFDEYGSTKTKKMIGGLPVRLAHAGSSTALKSDPAALALIDEADELMANVKNQGDPVGLVDARGDTYADFTNVITSTPSKGPKSTVYDEASGLDFWADQDRDDLESKIWSLWQEGTRYHWTWKCPECSERFIPRFECLEIPDVETTTPLRAKREAHLVCPRNGCVITDEAKTEMNETGVYVAPGQSFDEDGNVVGDPPDSLTISFWVSGLCSPFKTFGDRAAAYIEALRSGLPGAVQTVVNAGFGELWAPMGKEKFEWEEVKSCQIGYRNGDVPTGVHFLTAGVDVQKDRLPFVIRGWGPREGSWLIDAGVLRGDTSQEDVWNDLADVLGGLYAGLPIQMMFVDAGFRPGKKFSVPEHRVYEFARRFPRTVRATKGYNTRPTPISENKIDVDPRGGKRAYSLELMRLDTDHFKSWVFQRIRWEKDQPGAWFVFDGISDEYCKQVVSEARVTKVGGGHQWVKTYSQNHFLDCEALSVAAAYKCNVFRLRGYAAAGGKPPIRREVNPETGEETPLPPPQRKVRPSSFLGPRKSIW